MRFLELMRQYLYFSTSNKLRTGERGPSCQRRQSRGTCLKKKIKKTIEDLARGTSCQTRHSVEVKVHHTLEVRAFKGEKKKKKLRTWSKPPFDEEDRLEIRAARCERLKVHHIYMANTLYDAGARAKSFRASFSRCCRCCRRLQPLLRHLLLLLQQRLVVEEQRYGVS
jgi:hypothetical protein